MKRGDRVEADLPTAPRLHKRRGKVISVSTQLVVVRFDGEDYEFSLSRECLRVLSAVEHLAEKAE